MIFEYQEILIITLLSIFQSIFGVGLLLFGTPIFLILGNDFLDSLNILIPVSIMISFLQIKSGNINYTKNIFVKKFNTITIPSLLIALIFFVTNYKNFNINLFVSLIIIFFSLMNIFYLERLIKKNDNRIFDNSIYLLVGLVHGMTNLGGSLLTLASTRTNRVKEQVRYCIAYGYLIMGFLQLICINLFTDAKLNIYKLSFIFIPFLIYKVSQVFYKSLSNLRYNLILNLIALNFGIYIFIKYIKL